MKKNTRPFQTAIIDIGSHSVRLDIFEVGPDGSRLLENLSRPLNLGLDVFRTGAISAPLINQLSGIMASFGKKLKEYGVKHPRIVATSAIREAFNRELVISRIRHDTGMAIEILEAQEEARVTFLAVREELSAHLDFAGSSGIVFIIGTGSLIFIYFEDGSLKLCEAINVGTIRTADEFGRTALNSEQIIETLNSIALGARIQEATGIASDKKMLLIGIGAGIRLLARKHSKDQQEKPAIMPPETALVLAEKAIAADPGKLAAKLNVPDHLAMSLAPCGNLLKYFLQEFNCSGLICPYITTRTALLAEEVRHARNPEDDPFRDDIISAAACVGHKYGFDLEHTENVKKNALLFFDKLKRYYDFAPRSRICLEVAAILHDIGRFVDIQSHHKHSYYLIMHSQLPGLSASEQRIVATVSRYHRKAPPKPSHAEYVALSADEKVAVLKLAAILRVADALDRSRSRIGKLKLQIRGDELLILTPNADLLELEKLYLEFKGDLFLEVFGLKLKIESDLEKL
jgi:exopolyphosphatase/guanosine-5'-triphosphate,3'-diphosphate pyrophosphatase